ncbi:ABC transporter permease [Amycolatopsis magusensis]|uniref:Transport permease protein n=1 Tax=Amycolatopsis magusensis TaxID=882444 RepID=A0ABS4PIL0_9PSEU|nr:ABC transporter permease [Amycolatopsis magusensis]MBP2179226.1 oleandomycin transport system permease protein [Amycolatopsis magusensis]MDI5976435.1 ABC transporter permease [Amycolatopsis magusensis]
MTTAIAAPPPRYVSPARSLKHGLTLAWRGVLKIRKNPEQLADVVLMPIVFLAMFVYLFGGAISGDTGAYLTMVVPGVMVMNIMQVSLTIGVHMNTDVSKGLYDRFRSMPIARSAPLFGAVLADVVRYLVCLVVLLVVATVMGYRIATDPLSLLAATGLVVLFGLCFCWISVFVGMLMRTPGSVQGLMFVFIMPLSFGSNVFVPSDTMPGWLQAWTDISPVSLLSDALRGLLNGGAVTGPLLGALAWMAAVLAVFFPLAMRSYRKRVT